MSRTDRIEDQTWYDYRSFIAIAEQIDRMQNIFMIGSIRKRNMGPGGALPFFILKIAEGGDPHDRFRFFLTEEQAVDHRVLRGLEDPEDSITYTYRSGVRIYDPIHGSKVK